MSLVNLTITRYRGEILMAMDSVSEELTGVCSLY